MTGRFGSTRVPGCTCDFNFTCRACLLEGTHRVHAETFGVVGDMTRSK